MGRPWQARRSRETEVAAGRAYRDLGLARGTAKAAQVLRMMRSFVRMNPDLARGSRDDFMCAFVGQLTEERNAAGKKVRCHSTIQSYVREIEKYGMRADNLEEIGARLNAAALRAGIAAKRREEDPIVRHRMVAPENYMAPIIQGGDPVLRAGAYLLLATGARAEHLTRIRRVRLTPKSVRILWGDRKIRERMNCYMTYPYAWSCAGGVPAGVAGTTEKIDALEVRAIRGGSANQRQAGTREKGQGGWPDQQFLPASHVHPLERGLCQREPHGDGVRAASRSSTGDQLLAVPPGGRREPARNERVR